MEEDISTRYVFMVMLAVADPYGYVIGTNAALARRFNMPPADFERAVTRLSAPDPTSNSKEHEGRRLVSSDGEQGYRIVNFIKYRDFRDEEHRREYNKRQKREARAHARESALEKDAHSQQPRAKRGSRPPGTSGGTHPSLSASVRIGPPESAHEEVDVNTEEENTGGREDSCTPVAATDAPPPPPPNLQFSVPSREEAIASTATAGVDPDFAGYVFDSWFVADGKDANNRSVPFLRYVTMRWQRERQEWTAGTHRGRKTDAKGTSTRKPDYASGF